MTDQQMPHLVVTGRHMVECGGIRFEATFRAPAGATLRVFGEVDGYVTELLRFDDFIEGPHYHVPAAGDPIPFDQATLGEPLAWFVSQIRDHLAERLTEAGFATVLSYVDLEAVTDHAEDIRKAMEACVPEGYLRVPGAGLRRSPT
ncbi:MAG: DUF7700 domain-containing protein [Acidimicrobiales bacterium]